LLKATSRSDSRTRGAETIAWRRWALSCLFISLGACQCAREDFDAGAMSITPSNAEAIAGGAPILLTVTGTWIAGSVSWSVEGPGSISPVDQFTASYVPPISVTATSSATVRALSSTGRRALAAITVRPDDGLLTVVPPTASVYAGGAPILFSANVMGSTGTVSWSLSGPGTMSVVGALSASYTPPASVARDATAVLTALLSNPSRAVPANIAVRQPLGNLTVDVSVPAGSGLVPTIRVDGPNGFSRSLRSSQTFTGVLAGIYTVNTRTESLAGPIATRIYQPTTVGAPATVRPGGASRVDANYRLRPGSGHLWAVDPYGMRLRAYAGSQLGASGSVQASIDIAAGTSSFPMSAAMGANGQLWVALNPFTLARYSSVSLVSGSQPPDVTLGGAPGGFLDFTLGLAFDSSGNLWLTSNAPSGGPGYRRLLKYSSQRLTASAPNPAPDLTIRSPVYWYPSALAFDAAGNLWVADSVNHKLLRYNRNQLSQDGIPAPAVTLANSAPRVPLSMPVDLAFDQGGNLWVANLGDGSPPGTLIMYTPSQAAAGGVPNPTITIARSSLRGPRGMAFDASGGLWFGVNQGLVRYAPSQLLSSGEPTPQTVVRDPAMDSPLAVIFNPPSADTPLFR
jgi:sugar lactone lactonase YvrE